MKEKATFDEESASKVLDQITEALSKAEGMKKYAPELVTLGLKHVGRLERAKLRSMQIGRAALVTRLGKDDARIASLDSRIAAHGQVGVTLESLQARAAAAAPAMPRGRTALYGRVIAANGTPVGGVQVMALDSTGKTVGEDGTDPKGRFEIRLEDAVDAAAVAAEALEARQAPPGGRDAGPAGVAAGTAPREEDADQADDDEGAPRKSQNVIVQVRDSSGRIRHRHATKVPLHAARTTYLEIRLEKADERTTRDTAAKAKADRAAKAEAAEKEAATKAKAARDKRSRS